MTELLFVSNFLSVQCFQQNACCIIEFEQISLMELMCRGEIMKGLIALLNCTHPNVRPFRRAVPFNTGFRRF